MLELKCNIYTCICGRLEGGSGKRVGVVGWDVRPVEGRAEP